MANLEIGLLMLTIVGLLLGCCAISWARTSRKQARIFLGRCLFVGTLIFLGASGSVAALHRADGLIPLGLSSGFLLVGMLWELPHNSRHN